jgi:hypothetical protein
LARRWWELHSYIGSLKKIAKTVTREQDAAVRRRHMDVPSANKSLREDESVFWLLFVAQQKVTRSRSEWKLLLSSSKFCYGSKARKSFHSLRERVTFFAGAKKVTKETPRSSRTACSPTRHPCRGVERRTSCAPSRFRRVFSVLFLNLLVSLTI